MTEQFEKGVVMVTTNGAEPVAAQEPLDTIVAVANVDTVPSSLHGGTNVLQDKAVNSTLPVTLDLGNAKQQRPQDDRTDMAISRARKCAVCQKVARYCCPKCSLRTCSLGCVQAHKQHTGCDGIRDRAAFIAMSKFTDLDLLSDYRFLEESARTVDNAVRNPVVKPHRRETLPPHLYNMQKLAWGKMRVSLQFLPQMFARHRLNRTSIKKSHFHWTLELQAPQGQLTVIKHDVPSSTTVKNIIAEFLEHLTTHEKEKAAALINASIGEICALMKAVGRPANRELYFELDADLSLEENLRGKMLVEFPILVVISRDHLGAFQIDQAVDTNQAAKPTELPSFFREDDGSDLDANEQEVSHSGTSRKKQRNSREN